LSSNIFDNNVKNERTLKTDCSYFI